MTIHDCKEGVVYYYILQSSRWLGRFVKIDRSQLWNEANLDIKGEHLYIYNTGSTNLCGTNKVLEVREATPEEVEHYEQCVAAKKYVEYKPSIKSPQIINSYDIF
jgi:hypothetical protein